MSYYLPEMSWPEVDEYLKKDDIVLITCGSLEQHGYHLPLGVDTYIPMWVTRKLAEKNKVVYSPAIPFAPCEWHMGFKGTVSLSPKTMISLIFDVCESFYRHGFRNFVIINGHTSGNNPSLLCAADEVQKVYADAKLWIVDTVLMAKEAVFDACENDILYHADEVEASQMLVARPDLVHLEKSKDIEPDGGSATVRLDYRSTASEMLFRVNAPRWKKLTEDGNVGNPVISTEEKGFKMMNALVDNVSAFIADIRAGKVI